MELIEKLQELGLPAEYADGSFAPTIHLIDLEEAKKIGRYLFAYGVRLSKASEMKYYLYNEEEIKKVVARLQYCQDNNIDYIDENGNNKDFIFNATVFSEQFPNANLTNIVPNVFRDKEVISEDMMNVLDIDVTVGLTEDNYDRYVELESKLTNVMQVLNGTGEIDPEITNNLIKLISSTSYTDREILFAALVYGQNRSAEEIEKINEAIDQVVLSSLNQGGTLNL